MMIRDVVANMTRKTRSSLILVAAVMILTIVALATRPGPTIAGDGPMGTLAYQRVAKDLGFDVSTGDRPPALDEAFVIIADLRRARESDEVIEWVQAGGRLILVVQGSPTAAELGIESTSRASGGISGATRLAIDCDLFEVAGVDSIVVRSNDRRIQAPRLATPCIVDDRGDPYLTVGPLGRGTLVLLGGSSTLVNEGLREGENALFALSLLGDVEHVRFGTPGSFADSEGLWASLPDGGRAIVLGIIAAVLLLAAWGWRRLGAPANETPLAGVGSGTLVDAMAGLYRESADRPHIARRLQAHVQDLARRRTGLAVDTTTEDIAVVVADIVRRPRQDIQRQLTRVPTDAADLVVLARELHELTNALEQH